MNYIIAATSLQPDGSAGFTATVVVAGLGIVLGTLAFLIVIFSLFGKIVSSSQQKVKERKNKKDASGNVVPPPPEIKTALTLPPPPPISKEGLAPEIVAAISAAVYMIEGEGAVIKSIRRAPKRTSVNSSWADAAIKDNTRPF